MSLVKNRRDCEKELGEELKNKGRIVEST